jgi:hypothetical protein
VVAVMYQRRYQSQSSTILSWQAGPIIIQLSMKHLQAMLVTWSCPAWNMVCPEWRTAKEVIRPLHTIHTPYPNTMPRAACALQQELLKTEPKTCM